MNDDCDILREALRQLQFQLHDVFCGGDYPCDEWCEFARLILEGKKAAAYRALEQVKRREKLYDTESGD